MTALPTFPSPTIRAVRLFNIQLGYALGMGNADRVQAVAWLTLVRSPMTIRVEQSGHRVQR